MQKSLQNRGQKTLLDQSRFLRRCLGGLSAETRRNLRSRFHRQADHREPSRRPAPIAERRGWQVVEQYNDAGISGSKGRDGRPGLDQMPKDASRRKFDVVMACAIDRLGGH
jgi:hypothetical protein